MIQVYNVVEFTMQLTLMSVTRGVILLYIATVSRMQNFRKSFPYQSIGRVSRVRKKNIARRTCNRRVRGRLVLPFLTYT